MEEAGKSKKSDGSAEKYNYWGIQKRLDRIEKRLDERDAKLAFLYRCLSLHSGAPWAFLIGSPDDPFAGAR